MHDVLRSSAGRRVLEEFFPGLTTYSGLEHARVWPMRLLAELYPDGVGSEATTADLWDALAAIEPSAAGDGRAPAAEPHGYYEGADVLERSAKAEVPAVTTLWSTIEIEIAGPSHGNPFIEADLTARFTRDGAPDPGASLAHDQPGDGGAGPDASLRRRAAAILPAAATSPAPQEQSVAVSMMRRKVTSR